MSTDIQDVAHSASQAQRGVAAQFWPIFLDPTKLQLGQEVEININPCDHIWLPICYDPSMGLNPAQTGLTGFGIAAVPLDPTGVTYGLTGNPFPFGVNITDAYDPSLYSVGGYPGTYFQTAAVFSLRFNSPNNPWIMWGLGGASAGLFTTYGEENNINGPMGAASLMRSITGPISRLWYKLLIPAAIQQDNTDTLGWSTGTVGFNFSQIRLLSSLGVNQATSFYEQAGASDTGGTPLPPVLSTVSGGGYITPQLNTLERLAAESGTGLRKIL